MDLWIRSQNKQELVQVDCVCIEINEYDTQQYDIVQGCITLGTYKTKERALEVLDEIENILCPKKSKAIIGKNVEFIPALVYVYEMPED